MAVKQLRKVVVLSLLEQEFQVDADFRAVEVLERNFDLSADALIGLFGNRARVQRGTVASVVAELLARSGCKVPRAEVREAIICLDVLEFAVILDQLQSVLLFTLKQMSAEEFDDITRELDTAKKKPASLARPSDSSPPATA